MKLAFVAHHVPQPSGTAAGRQLWAVGEALVAAGHEVTAWCWQPAPPSGAVPGWCEWRPLPSVGPLRSRGRSLLWPRSDVVRGGWSPPGDAVRIADDPGSWPAVAAAEGPGVVTVHFSVPLDRRALDDWNAPAVQDLRAERRAVRQAAVVWSLSERVRDQVGRGRFVPPCIPLPASPVPRTERPVVGLLADWSWKPNVVAADALLRTWPEVRARVPGARLLLAGRGMSPVGTLAGVEWLGEVASSEDLLGQTAVFAFPCPPTSGPKMKVMDALAHGVAVLTTPAGVEGLTDGSSAAAVCSEAGFAEQLVALLADPEQRDVLAARGRQVLQRWHAPAYAAQVRVEALTSLVAA